MALRCPSNYVAPTTIASFSNWVAGDNSNLTSINLSNCINLTTIAERVFDNCTSLTSVTLPNSLESIGNGAFSRCTSLTSITLPNLLESIGDGAFSRCTSLTSITLPNTLESIGESAFSWCSSLTAIILPNSLKTIGQCSFSDCTNLTSIDFGDNINNWYVYTNSTYTSGETAISSTDLENNATAATLLKTTYQYGYWKNKTV